MLQWAQVRAISFGRRSRRSRSSSGRWSGAADSSGLRPSSAVQRYAEFMARIDAEIDVLYSEGSRAVHVLRQLWKFIQRRRATTPEAREARAILGIDPKRPPAYRHISRHSHFDVEHPHPDNADALETAAHHDLVSARQRKRLLVVPELTVPIEKSMVLLGSPTAEAMTRDIFGYEPVEGFEDALVQTRRPLDLPFRWVLDPSEIDPGARASRVVRGRGIISRPNWRIVDDRTGKPYIPEVRDGVLDSDYLLVTRLRNFLTQKAYDTGQYLVSFGGAHGTGTRAIELLLSDNSVLERIAEELGHDPVAYQLLLRVGRLTHTEREGTRAHAIELVAAELLEDREERWREAAQTILPSINPWLRHDDPGEPPRTLF